MNTKIVPFGKYKGQPVEVLAQDPGYLNWLQAQSWFRERYPGVYTLIVNNFTEASETPEHNALQILFLNDEFCTQFVIALDPQCLTKAIAELRQNLLNRKQELTQRREEAAKDLARGYKPYYTPEQLDHALADFPSTVSWATRFNRQFEDRGVDVRLQGWVETAHKIPAVALGYGGGLISATARTDLVSSANIEIKPTVSDDYPAVLRQMRRNQSNVLFTEAYTGAGATEEQFVSMFAVSQIKVVFRRDVEIVRPAEYANDIELDDHDDDHDYDDCYLGKGTADDPDLGDDDDPDDDAAPDDEDHPEDDFRDTF